MEPQFIEPVANRQTARKIPGKLIIVVVGIVVLLIAAAGLMIALNSNNPVEKMDQLNARMSALQAIAETGRKSARNPNVVKIASDASILINSDVAAIKTATTQAGATGKSKEAIAGEDSKKIVADLQKAAVDSRFDREYVKTLTDKLISTQELLAEVNKSSSKSNVKAATKTTYEHFNTLIESLKAIRL